MLVLFRLKVFKQLKFGNPKTSVVEKGHMAVAPLTSNIEINLFIIKPKKLMTQVLLAIVPSDIF